MWEVGNKKYMFSLPAVYVKGAEMKLKGIPDIFSYTITNDGHYWTMQRARKLVMIIFMPFHNYNRVAFDEAVDDGYRRPWTWITIVPDKLRYHIIIMNINKNLLSRKARKSIVKFL